MTSPALSLPDAFAALDDRDPTPVPGGDALVVVGHRILGTDTWVYEAWEPSPTAGASHATIRRIDGLPGWYGSVASGPIPEGLATVAERLDALAALRRTSVLAVRAARPDVAHLLDLGYGRIDGGRVEVTLPR